MSAKAMGASSETANAIGIGVDIAAGVGPSLGANVSRQLSETVLKNNSFIYKQLATVNLSMAIRIIFSSVVTRISKSLANRRKWPNQAKVLSTIQR